MDSHHQLVYTARGINQTCFAFRKCFLFLRRENKSCGQRLALVYLIKLLIDILYRYIYCFLLYDTYKENHSRKVYILPECETTRVGLVCVTLPALTSNVCGSRYQYQRVGTQKSLTQREHGFWRNTVFMSIVQ